MSSQPSQNLLVLGASGMLGSTLVRYFTSKLSNCRVIGTVRSPSIRKSFSSSLQDTIVDGVDVSQYEKLVELFSKYKPDIVFNCVGLVKQLETANNPLEVLPINTMLPHQLAGLCKLTGARLIHFSTDCVFSGQKGLYREEDISDAVDLYGRSKLLGEVADTHCLTLRTSIIGHELAGHRSLIDWFLNCDTPVEGFRNAVFSGLPTVEIARILVDHVIFNTFLHGLYHLSADPIDKFSLLKMVARAYGKRIEIRENSSFKIDRSLDSSRFRKSTGFQPESWENMIERMQIFR